MLVCCFSGIKRNGCVTSDAEQGIFYSSMPSIIPDHSGVGIDESETGINFANKTAKLSNYGNYNFMVGNIDTLSNFRDGEFDGIILSNVLDVMPESVADETVKELDRVLKNQGYWFIKVNPFYSRDEIKEMEYEEIGDHMYVENGILRLRQETTLYWINYFHRLGKIERILEFEYPWQKGLNRLFLVRKVSYGTKRQKQHPFGYAA